MFDNEVEKKLQAKLDSSVIKQREEAGFNLDYLEGWYVISKLNEVFGFGNWSYEVKELIEISRGTRQKNGKTLIEIGYRARVRVEILGRAVISREDVGFGSGIAPQEYKAHENAGKEAVTDALKRACRTFGDVFGNTLYDKEKRGVIDLAKEEKLAKDKIMSIIKELAPKENAKNVADYIKNNGVDISNDPLGALENEQELRALITEYLENKPSSAFDSEKGE